MEDSRSDAEVIKAALERPAEFGRVFERHWDSVFRYLERRLGANAAQDLASEVFRIAFQRRWSYKIVDGTSCLPWLYGIASNLALKERRGFARHLAAVDRFSRITTGGVDDHASHVAASVDSEQIWTQVQAALNTIDDESREMLLLVAWEGLSYEQVAQAFDVPLGTVRSRLHRARARLRTTLSPLLGPPVDNSIQGSKR
jgi:RNA polymerase sigma-70 factor (ECF subfamily)